ncbi:MAG: hypothetical protein ACOC90_08425 [Bacteroidota bacterium]
MDKKEYQAKISNKTEEGSHQERGKQLLMKKFDLFNNGVEDDRPTVQELESKALAVYEGTNTEMHPIDEKVSGKTANKNGDNLPVSHQTEIASRLDGQDDLGGKNEQSEKKEEAQTQERNPRKTELDFFHDFKEAFCEEEPDLFHTPNGDAFISINLKGRITHVPINSVEFTRMCHYFSIQMNKTPACSNACIRRLQNALEALAIYEGQEKTLHTRYAGQDNNVYIDLARKDGQQCRITPEGFEIIEAHASPIKFFNNPGLQPMPIPQRGIGLDVLKSLMHLDDDDWVMLVGWMLSVMNPDGPYPFLILQGTQGSTKTTTTKMLKALLDPSSVAIQSLPKSEENLVIAANNSWLLSFDNMSGISPAMADAFCRISTGGGFRRRQLYKNARENLFSPKRPIVMNSITDITARGDFLDRSIIVHLKAPNGSRSSELEINNLFNDFRPELFGSLCDAISMALRDHRSLDIPNLPRMADFSKWVTAAEPALEWEQGTFLRVYEEKRSYQTEITIEGDPIAQAVIRLMDSTGQQPWEGTPTELLEELEAWTTERIAKSREWPKAANVLSNHLQRSAPSLREKGINFERSKSGNRKITLSRIVEDGSDAGHNDDPEAQYWEKGAV